MPKSTSSFQSQKSKDSDCFEEIRVQSQLRFLSKQIKKIQREILKRNPNESHVKEEEKELDNIFQENLPLVNIQIEKQELERS